MLKFLLTISFIIVAYVASSSVFCDWPKNWQLSFQDPASPICEGIINLHHDIMFFLIFIAVMGLATICNKVLNKLELLSILYYREFLAITSGLHITFISSCLVVLIYSLCLDVVWCQGGTETGSVPFLKKVWNWFSNLFSSNKDTVDSYKPYKMEGSTILLQDKATQTYTTWSEQFKEIFNNLFNYFFTTKNPTKPTVSTTDIVESASIHTIKADGVTALTKTSIATQTEEFPTVKKETQFPESFFKPKVASIHTIKADGVTALTKTSIATQTEEFPTVKKETQFPESFFKPKGASIAEAIKDSLKKEPVVPTEEPLYVDPSKEEMVPIPQSFEDSQLAHVIQNSIHDLPERNPALYDKNGLLKQPIAKITDPNVKMSEWDGVTKPVNHVISSTSGVEKASKGVYSAEFLKAWGENPTNPELVALIDANNPPVLPPEGTLVPLNAVGVPVAPVQGGSSVKPQGLEAYYDVD